MAKKFTFEFQDILDFRNFEREQAEAELAKAIAVETEIKNNLQNIAGQFVALKQSMDSMTNFEDLAAGSTHKKFLEYQKEELLKQLAEANIVTEQKRAVLAEIMKKTTALEELKEDEKAEYQKALDYEENEFVDDLATGRYKK